MEGTLKSIGMQLRVRVLPAGQNQTLNLEEGANPLRLMDVLSLNPDAHLVLREGRPIPADSTLEEGDEISIVTVISGG